MRTKLIRIMTVLLTLVITSSTMVFAGNSASTAIANTRSIVPSKLLAAEDQYDKDWYAFDLARDGQKVPSSYYNNLAKYIEDNEGVLSDTDYYYVNYSRAILAFTAGGYDASNIKGYNLLAYLNDTTKVEYGGVSGVAYAILAIDSNTEYVGEVTAANETALIQYLLDQQCKEEGDNKGAWGYEYQGFNPDIDSTAMALQALAGHTGEQGVDAAIAEGIAYLKSQLQADGSYQSWGAEASGETYSQVVIALLANGEDYTTGDWIKASNPNFLERICNYSLTDGGFYNNYYGQIYNNMATEQCYMGVIAALKYSEYGSDIFNMNDIELSDFEYIAEEASKPSVVKTGDDNGLIYSAILLVAAIILGGVYGFSRKNQEQ